MTYFTSDLHFCHNKPFLYEDRGFSAIEEHNEAIVKNWNSLITDDDDVYILGDLILKDTDKGIEYVSQLKGKIHIILGNHDTEARKEIYESMFGKDNVSYANVFKYNNFHFYLSHYPTICRNYDSDKPLKAQIINLCGHSHTKDKFADFDKGLIYHCELDAHNMTPVSIETIISDIKNQVSLIF